MIRPGLVLAVARTEARLARRLVRYWVFVTLAFLFGLGVYLWDTVAIHWMFSSWSGTVAAMSPHYLMARYATSFLLLFSIGVIFLGFDARARDVRERIVEVLDAQPITNLELLSGRFLGILFMSWIPAFFLTVVLWILGLILGESIQWLALVDFITLMAIPALAFMLGLVFLVSLLVRHRLVAAVILILFPVFFLFVNFFPIPAWLGAAFNVLGTFASGYPSDLAWLGADIWSVAQRGGVLLAGLAFLVLATAVHPRRDDGSRGVRAGVGVAVLALAVLLEAGAVLSAKSWLDLNDSWRLAHEARSGEPAPDLLSISGSVDIVPARELGLDLVLRFAAPADAPIENALFSLNPGLAVEGLEDEGGSALEFSFEDGLLDISLPGSLDPGSQTSVRVTARGIPDPRFAYLDAVRHPLRLAGQDGALFILGFVPLAFERSYVALMPGACWLPASGTQARPPGAAYRGPDFFDLDLAMEIPEDWLAAGPGRRQPVDGAPAGRVRYRYNPPAPVPEVALIASRFESRGAEVDGVWMELLLHPGHTRNLAEFTDAVDEIRTWLENRLAGAEELGLPYPYDALTMVEVPSGLRLYGGGWRMDTAMAPPAVILMRDVGFPLAHFGGPFWKPEDSKEKEGGVARAKREGLERFFENDFNGGNPFVGASRNFFQFQTAATGEIGPAINFAFERLVTELIMEKRGYFSAHIFDRALGDVIGGSISRFDGETDVVDLVLAARTSRLDVWDTVLGVALTDLDPWEDPTRALDVLMLKGDALARSIRDGLGREQTGRLLATLREQHRGSTFTREDLVAVGEQIGVGLEEILEVWLDETELPGFVVTDPHGYRIPDTEDGSPRYQVGFTLRNDESAPGLFVVETRSGAEHDRRKETSEPMQLPGLSAVEVGVVRSEPPATVRVVPYLSLNREPFAVPVPAIDEEKIEEREPLTGARSVSWTAPELEGIKVDDLDPGFSVEESGERPWWRLGGRSADEDTDNGLPVHQPGTSPSRWSRLSTGSATGKYRHTLAVIRGGEGDNRAVFTSEIPEAGRWELQLYVPAKPERRRGPLARDRGTWHLVVLDDSGREEIAFDADAGEDGWNALGSFELAGGETRVELSDNTDGKTVVADAIRWIPPKRDRTKG